MPIHSPVEFPEPALFSRCSTGLGRLHRLGAKDGEITPFDPQLPGVDIALDELWFGVPAELGAERAAVIRIDDQYDRRIDWSKCQRVMRV
ncbi:Uncharacterised protein [Mycobacteroides abscessus subsp. massiliense]|nr:Uncharacterised protein [Mycobacteroides abscessus subsp. massiliense]